MLSPIVEYLLSLNRPGGGRLCYQHRMQFLIDPYPPLTQLLWSLAPPLNSYAAIKYSGTVSENTIPGAFFMEAVHAGNLYISGFIEADWMREYLAYFLMFTRSEPIYFRLVNTSTLNQQFIGTQWSLLITTEQDLQAINRHLAEYSANVTGKLAQETNQLLRQIDTHLRRP